MLTSMRRHSKFLSIFLWLVIFAFLATIVVVWGVGERQGDLNYAAKVGDYTVTYNEYQIMERQASELRRLSSDVLSDEQFRKIVLDDIVNNRLLILEAESMGIPVSDWEVMQAITQQEMFMTNGVFDVEKYQQLLEQNGIRVSLYEKDVRTNILLSKMKQLVENSVSVTDEEIAYEFSYQNQKVGGAYFLLDSAKFVSKDAPSESDLSAYYAQANEQYRVPAEIKVKSIQFNIENFDYQPNVSDDAVRARYTENIGQYTTPEALDLSHISVGVADWNDNESVSKAVATLELAIADLKKGKAFGDTAVKYSEDPSVKSNKGFLGRMYRPEGELSADEQTIFDLKSGEISGIVRSESAMHVFKVENHVLANIISFDQVKGDVRKELEKEGRNNAYRSHLYQVYRDIISAGNITAYLQLNPGKYSTSESGYISQNNPNAFFAQDADLERLLFTAGVAEVTPMTEIGGYTYIYEILDRKNSYIPSLEEVRSSVVAEYRLKNAQDVAVASVESKIKGNKLTIAEHSAMAKEFGVTATTMKPFSRMEQQPVAAWASDMADTLLALDKGDVVIYPVSSNNTVYVVLVDDKIAPDEEGADEAKYAASNYLLSQKRAEAVKSLVANLQKKYKVTINERLITNN